MKDFFNDSVIWFGLGLAFFLLEFILPGFILFFFGVGAWIVALLSLFLDISINIQIVLFIASSVITVLLFRNWLKQKFGMTEQTPQLLENEFVGKIAKAETIIAPGIRGKVEFKGASWDASSVDTISAGENVIIVETRSILLIVKSTQQI